MKNKIKSNLIFAVCLVIALLLILSGHVRADLSESEEKVTEEGIIYSIFTYSNMTADDTAEDYVEIKGLQEGTTIEKLTIPETIEGYKVKVIAERAFENNTTIEEVVLSSNLTTIESYAFSGCTSLTNVQIKGYNISFLEFVFKDTLIETIRISTEVTTNGNCGLEGTSFAGMYNLKNIYIELRDSMWIWDNEEVAEALDGEYEDYLKNNVTIYGYSSTYEEDDATNAVMLSPKGFATKRGVKFVDLDTLEVNSLEDGESKITVYANMSQTATIVAKKLDTDSEEYKSLLEQVNNAEVALAYDISLTSDYEGKIKVTLPVDSKYNGKTATILHKKADGTIEKFTSVVEEGKVEVEVTELSPFMVAMETYELGDVNNDGKINTLDVIMALQHISKKITLTDNQMLAADTSKDENVNTLDIIKILQYISKKITQF